MEKTTGATLGMAGHYNDNSLPQLAAIRASIPHIYRSIDALNTTSSNSLIIIADYGSSHGQNSLHVMKKIIEYSRMNKKIGNDQPILVVHNDLPTNDWNCIFDTLLKDNSYHGVASGKSFYEPCLPWDSVLIGYSSIALHWLSKKPCNLSDHCVSSYAGNKNERAAFNEQAVLDYTRFLHHRSCELKSGGVLILVFLCVNNEGSAGNVNSMNLLYKCAQTLLTPQELLDYTIPIHFRSYADCVDVNVFSKSGFELINANFVEVKSPHFASWQQGELTLDQFAQARTGYNRAWSESALTQALSTNQKSNEEIEKILSQFWKMHEQEVREKPYEHNTVYYETCVTLKKI